MFKGTSDYPRSHVGEYTYMYALEFMGENLCVAGVHVGHTYLFFGACVSRPEVNNFPIKQHPYDEFMRLAKRKTFLESQPASLDKD